LREMSTKEGRRARSDFVLNLREGLNLNIRFWLSKNGKIVCASGRINLLENIERFGSISKAAKSMNISYRHAWVLLDGMRKAYGKNIVKTKVGGVKGGGAELTEEGRKLIERFYHYKKIISERLKGVK